MSDPLALRGVVGRHAAGAGVTVLLSLAAAAAGVALLGVSGWFLTGAALTTAALSFNLFGPSSLVRGLSFLRIGTRYGEKLLGHAVTLRILTDLRERLFRQLIPRVPLRHGGFRHGDLVSRLVADVDGLDAVFVAAIAPGLTVLGVGAALGAVLAVVLPQAAAVFGCGFALASLAVPAVLVTATRRTGREAVAAKARLRSAVLDGIAGHADLVVFGRTGAARDAAAGDAAALSAVAHRQSRAGAAASAALGLLSGMTTLGTFACGLAAVRDGRLGAAALVGLTFAVLAAFEAAAALVRGSGRLGIAWAAWERLHALGSAPPVAAEPAAPRALPMGAGLRFDGVSFSHRAERPLLRGLDLDCPPGSRTAIVGESGCGKSTLLALALRLAEPAAGSVRVAGVDVSRVAARDHHARVALLSQASPVFLGTIRHNLRLGRPHATEDALWRALAAARLDAFVAALPDGLDTWCGEGGRSLSAGQARRLCLARILLTPAEILLLDEPTSGLDGDAERAFLDTLTEATAGRTVLLVTHAALPHGAVDRVLRLSGGRLTEVEARD